MRGVDWKRAALSGHWPGAGTTFLENVIDTFPQHPAASLLIEAYPYVGWTHSSAR